MLSRTGRLTIASLTLGLFASPSLANVATGTFQVTITIQKACSVTAGSGSNISLGTVASTAANTLGSNTDTLPYQLSSTVGPSGAVWGNTAATTTVGNGVSATGTGSSQTRTIYVTAASASFTPDTYTDTAPST